MHPQIIGRPSRITLLEELIKYILGHSRVWLARCDEVADAVRRPCARRPAREAGRGRRGARDRRGLGHRPGDRALCSSAKGPALAMLDRDEAGP